MACPLSIIYSGDFYHTTNRVNRLKNFSNNIRERENTYKYLMSALKIHNNAQIKEDSIGRK